MQEVEPRPKDGTPLSVSDGYGLRRPLARLGMGLDRCRRRVQGDDVDIDAVVEARVEAMAGSAPDEAVYVESLAAGAISPCSSFSTSRAPRPNPARRARRCTSNSGRRPPRSPLRFTISAIAWRSTPTTRRGGPPCS